MKMLDPVSYLDMLCLESQASTILTDSGGVQKEAFWLRVPCITIREETEWVETVESGWNVLAGTETESIVSKVKECHPGNSSRWPWEKGEASKSVAKLLTRVSF